MRVVRYPAIRCLREGIMVSFYDGDKSRIEPGYLLIALILVVIAGTGIGFLADQGGRAAGPGQGYYGITKSVPEGCYCADDVGLGLVKWVSVIDGMTIVKVEFTHDAEQSIVVWVIARDELAEGEECVVRWEDVVPETGTPYRERYAFKREKPHANGGDKSFVLL